MGLMRIESPMCCRAAPLHELLRSNSVPSPPSTLARPSVTLVEANLEYEAKGIGNPFEGDKCRPGPARLQAAHHGLGGSHPLGKLALAQPTCLPHVADDAAHVVCSPSLLVGPGQP